MVTVIRELQVPSFKFQDIAVLLSRGNRLARAGSPMAALTRVCPVRWRHPGRPGAEPGGSQNRKGERNKNEGKSIPSTPDAGIVAMERRIVPVTVRRAGVPWIVVPGTAPQHPILTA